MSAINKSIFIRASAEHVWSYLTEPDKLATWYHRPEQKLEEGHEYKMNNPENGEVVIFGMVLKSSPPKHLEVEFRLPQLGENITHVRFDLTPVPGGTRLSLEHSGLPADETGFDLIMALDAGWDRHLGDLRSNANN